jgi:uncharacterized protein (TIGR02301 family)
MTRGLPTLLILLALAAAGRAEAAEKAPAAAEAAAPPAAAAAAPAPAQPAPYEAPLLRLSELMGALHYLRGLCGAPDAPMWRQRMGALLDSESADEARKSRLAGAFNRGYRTYQQTYRTCNASAHAAIASYVGEGQKITRDIETRFSD